MSFTGRVILLISAVLCLGCETEIDRLDAKFGAAARDKLISVDEVLEKASAEGDVANGYQELLEAKEELEHVQMVSNADSLEESTREMFREQVASKEQQVQERLNAIAIDDAHNIWFSRGDTQNAATILLTADGTTIPADDFRVRNEVSAAWYLGGRSSSNAEDAADWYNRLRRLEYLLVIREQDIAPPEHQGQDEQGNEVYSLGAIECDAILFNLSDGEVIGRFRFVAPNQQSPIAFAGYDPFLSGDPGIGVRSLTDRLYQTAHGYAAAVAAELSENIQSEYEIKRDLLGHRLEQI